jgi:ribonucleotide monophosphatase NagD (HAD superfamily)
LAVVGDDLETDVRGGRAAGLVTIQVRTGKFDQALLDEALPDQRPDHIVSGLADVPSLLA